MIEKNLKINKNNHFTISQVLYMIAVVLNIFLRSMFHLGSIGIYLSYVPLVILLLISLWNNFNYKWLLWLIIGIIISIGTKSLQCLFMIFLIFASRDINLREILKPIVVIISVCLLIIYLATLVGIIPNLVLVRNGIERMAMGTQFPLVFSTYVLYACAYLTLIYYNSHPIKVSVLLFLIVIILNKLTNSRNDELCILLLILVIGINKLDLRIKKPFFLISYIITFILILFSVFVTQILPYTSNIYAFMDKLLSGRLNLQYILFSYYSPKLFGQNIPQQGLGGEQQVFNYFYIDNSYARILFMYGIIFFLFLLVTFGISIYKYYISRVYMLSFVLLILLLSGISADSLSLLTQNILVIPLFFIKVSGHKSYTLTLQNRLRKKEKL